MPRNIPWADLTDDQKRKALSNHKQYRERVKNGEAKKYVPRGTKLTGEQLENYRLWLELGVTPHNEDL